MSSPSLTATPFMDRDFSKNTLCPQNTILEIHQTGICGFQHLARHPGLQSTPLDAHRKMSMSRECFRLNCGARGELCQKTFENLMNRAILWIPKISALLLEQEDVLLQEKSFSEQRCEQCMGGRGGNPTPSHLGDIGSPNYPSRTLPRGKQTEEDI